MVRQVPLLGHPSQLAAVTALMAEGLGKRQIMDRSGLSADRTSSLMSAARRAEARKAARPGWTNDRVGKAIRIYKAALEVIAEAFGVSVAELLEVVTHQVGAPGNSSDGSHAPSRADDEAELARLAAEEQAAVRAPVEPAETQAGDGNGLRLKGNATLAQPGVGVRDNGALAAAIGTTQREDGASPVPPPEQSVETPPQHRLKQDNEETRTQEEPLPGSPGGKGMTAEDQRAGAPEAQADQTTRPAGIKSAPASGPSTEGGGVTDAGKPVAQAATPNAHAAAQSGTGSTAARKDVRDNSTEEGARAELLDPAAASTLPAGAQAPPVETPPQYRLKHDNGEYLDRSGVGFTRALRRAWQGSATQIEQIYRRRPEYRNLEAERVYVQ